MPQMMPLNWLELYMYTSWLFMMTITMNLYMYKYKLFSENKQKIHKKINWKW